VRRSVDFWDRVEFCCELETIAELRIGLDAQYFKILLFKLYITTCLLLCIGDRNRIVMVEKQHLILRRNWNTA
jgi:hypothetical protein